MFCIFFQKMPQLKTQDKRFKHIPGKLITIPAKDEVPKSSKIYDVREAQNQKMSETGGLASILELKISA